MDVGLPVAKHGFCDGASSPRLMCTSRSVLLACEKSARDFEERTRQGWEVFLATLSLRLGGCLQLGVAVSSEVLKHPSVIKHSGFGFPLSLFDSKSVPARRAGCLVPEAHVPTDITKGRVPKPRGSLVCVLGHARSLGYNPGRKCSARHRPAMQIVVQEVGEL